MSNSRALKAIVVVCVAVLFGGSQCNPIPDDRLGSAPSPFSPTPACPGDRYIGVLQSSAASCPAPIPGVSGGRWAGAGSGFRARGRGLPDDLKRFCVYEWSPTSTGSRPALELLPGNGNTAAKDWLSPDCQVIGARGELSDVPDVWTELRQTVLERAGMPASLPTSPAPQEVRVAVVDSSPDGYDSGEPGEGLSRHGRAVGLTIREISCPGTPCIGMVSDHLALKKGAPNAAETGGFYGTQKDLASAIWDAVEDWQDYQQLNPGKQRHLVVNLSLGWEGKPEYMRNGVPAVRAAITHAVCQGALVIAAAGNASGGRQISRGPLYPAAWETVPAPSPEECARFNGSYRTVTPPAPRGLYRPLVHAVGGVDATDLHLTNTRARGRPRLAAYGHHVTARDAKLRHSDVLTGTSMSAAVVSGIAAAVWGYHPELQAAEVMDRLYGTAPPLAKPAPSDFCLAGQNCGATWIRRPLLCRALGAGEGCPVVAMDPNPTWAKPVLVQGAVGSVSNGNCGVAPGCQLPANLISTQVAVPFVGPQPGSSGCDVCTIGQNSMMLGSVELFVSVREDFSDWTTVVLSADLANGGVAKYDLSAQIQPPGGRTFQVTLLGFPAQQITKATISFGNAEVATMEPVLVSGMTN